MLQKITFLSGMDSDTASEYFGEGKARKRVNVRVLSSDNDETNAIETVLGNTLVSYALPIGTNKIIGAKEDLPSKKVYYFLWNSLKSHQILEYDYVADSVTLVLKEATTAPYYLNFQVDHLITGINVVHLDDVNSLLYWTDNYVNPLDANDFNEPKKINIFKAKRYSAGDFINGYSNPFNPLWANTIKQPPLFPLTYTWSGIGSTDPIHKFTATSNITLNIPSLSQQTVPYNLDTSSPGDGFDTILYGWTADANTTYNITVNNTYFITGPAGHVIVPTDGYVVLELWINGVSTFFKSISSDIHVTNTSYSITKFFTNVLLNIGDFVEVVVTNNFIFTTYLTITNGSFSGEAIPTSNSASVNHLFKKLPIFKMRYIFDDNEQSAFSPISKYVMPVTKNSGASGMDIAFQDNIITITIPTGNEIVKRIQIAVKNVDATDYSLLVDLDKENFGIPDNSTYDYIINDLAGTTLIEVNESIKLFDAVPLYASSQELINENRLVWGNTTEGFNPVSIDMRLGLSFDVLETNPNTFFPAQSYLKSGGKYEFGIVYYDFSGNRSGLTNSTPGSFQTLNSKGRYGTSLYVPFLTDPAYLAPHGTPNNDMSYVPLVDMWLYNHPPTWATHYQILRSKNQTMGRYLQFSVNRFSVLPAGAHPGTTLQIYLDNIVGKFKEENPLSHLVYDFAQGDRIRFIANPVVDPPATVSDSISGITPFFNYIDVVISAYDSGGGFISVPFNSTMPSFGTTGLDGFNPGCLVEIYQPNNVIDETSEIIYEMGECYELITDIHGNLVHAGGVTNQIFSPFLATSISGTVITLTLPSGHGISTGQDVKITGNNGFSVYGVVIDNHSTSVDIDTTGFTILGTVNGSGEVVASAKTRLSGGDTYRRLRDMPFARATVYSRLYSYIEDAQVSDVFVSPADNIGRPNRIDDTFRRITRPSTIIYSQQFIPETFINGLSSVFPENFETYNQNFGGIYKLYCELQELITFQELKVSHIPIAQIIYNDLALSQTVGASSVVMSPQPIYYTGEYGIGKNPESFDVYGHAKYFIDVKRGVVCRLSIDGITPISDLGTMHNYFSDRCNEITRSGQKVNIYGVYDIKFNEFIINFEEYTYPVLGPGGSRLDKTVPSETVAWNERANQWSTFYTYFPDFMSSANTGIISFKQGALYKHNINLAYNTFYGIFSPSEFWVIFNANPSNVKILLAISEESNSPWEVYEINTPNGQTTNLIESDFQMKENNQYSSVFKDTNTPNVIDPFYNGDPMRDRTMIAKFRFNQAVYNKINAINFDWIQSNRSNK